jgi:drug/metabolite transporter (DMT)-like permease
MSYFRAVKGNDKKNGVLIIVTGLFFAILWPSASVATKFGLQVAQPFVICITRFSIAGLLMLVATHLILGNRLPRGKEWKQLAIYGLLNISIYLSLFVIAMQHVLPGLGSLSTATNPVFISLIAALVFRQRLHVYTIISLILCTAGVLVAAYPLFKNSYASPVGLLILLISMLSYSAGVIYFSKRDWSDLHILTINGWQTWLGGLFLLPFMLYTYKSGANTWNLQLAGAVLWLAIPVSIVAVLLWLNLLKDNAVKASFWLFLCPLFGFIMANVIMHEPIGIYTFAGMLLVIGGQYLVQKQKRL